jgi:hypothetical protein
MPLFDRGVAMTRTVRALGWALLLLCASAAAGPLDEAKVRDRLEAIAAGDVDVLMRDYDGSAIMQWIGGKFDGAYRGPAELRKLWQEFAASQGAMKLSIGELESYANPKGVTVLAKARYVGKLDVRVQHAFLFRDDKLVMEIWQIDPKIAPGK